MQETAAKGRSDAAARSDADHSFETVLAKYRTTFVKIASTFEADHDLQQDLLQEILLSVWQATARFRGESSLQTYVYRVAYNRALSHVAKQSRLPRHEELDENHLRGHPAPELHLEPDRGLGHLMSAIRRLPAIQRQLVTLSLEGLSYADISEVTGLSANNVGVKLHRAKADLKRIMEKNNDQRK